jgi:hypothetical protein
VQNECVWCIHYGRREMQGMYRWRSVLLEAHGGRDRPEARSDGDREKGQTDEQFMA